MLFKIKILTFCCCAVFMPTLSASDACRADYKDMLAHINPNYPLVAKNCKISYIRSPSSSGDSCSAHCTRSFPYDVCSWTKNDWGGTLNCTIDPPPARAAADATCMADYKSIQEQIKDPNFPVRATNCELIHMASPYTVNGSTCYAQCTRSDPDAPICIWSVNRWRDSIRCQ